MKVYAFLVLGVGLLSNSGLSMAQSAGTKNLPYYKSNVSKSAVSAPVLTASPAKTNTVLAAQLQGYCEKITAYERTCGGQTPSSCGAEDRDVVDDFVEVCFSSYTITSGDCIARLNQEYAAQFSQEKVAPCATTLVEAYRQPITATTMVLPSEPKLQVAPREATTCTYTAEQSRLICTVYQQCGDVSGETMLKCWDRGTLTLDANEMHRYSALAGDRTPRQLIDQDGCLQNYCANSGR